MVRSFGCIADIYAKKNKKHGNMEMSNRNALTLVRIILVD
jgi:hypothetical protein